jgi:hypothetical protein
MPPRLPLRPVTGPRAIVLTPRSPVCLFCSLSTSQRPSLRRTQHPQTTRAESTIAAGINKSTSSPRIELEETLQQLKKHATNYVNLSRVQLALQGLRQDPGEEAIRIAILGLSSNGGSTSNTAKEVVRTLLADPLVEQQQWERELAGHDIREPLVIRIRQPTAQEPGALTITKTNLLHEVDVSSPILNNYNLELLVMGDYPLSSSKATRSSKGLEGACLVPTVDIPSNTGRFTPVTTPVHKTLVVGDGITGAASLVALPPLTSKESVLPVVNLPNYNAPDTTSDAPRFVDVDTASQAIELFRANLGNAMEYERLWFQSNVPVILDWLKSGVHTEDGSTKPAVRQLIRSILKNATTAIQADEARGKFSASNTPGIISPSHSALHDALGKWAQQGHSELQEQLDIAFSGRRWIKLGWWKLFWRVDDVSMLTSDIINQSFLSNAERELIYLTGRIDESKIASSDGPLAYPQPVPVSEPKPKWPIHIEHTREYIQRDTIPALQALAQKLLLQATSTSALTTSLAALLYVSSFASTLYEAGAVAALGIVWSLRRMQKKWETARGFWEGEVREEGRKALRSVELSVSEVLHGTSGTTPDKTKAEELKKAKELVTRAEDTLSRLK